LLVISTESCYDARIHEYQNYEDSYLNVFFTSLKDNSVFLTKHIKALFKTECTHNRICCI